MSKLTYKDMYKRAARAINRREGNYKGYTGASALSLFVFDKYGVNAGMNPEAHGALCEAMVLLSSWPHQIELEG